MHVTLHSCPCNASLHPIVTSTCISTLPALLHHKFMMHVTLHTNVHVMLHHTPLLGDRLVGLVVKASALRAEDPGFKSHLHQDFFRGQVISDIKSGTPVATLPGTWHQRVSARTGWPDVSILWLGEMESLVCSFYLSVAARKIVWANPSLRYTCMLLER